MFLASAYPNSALSAPAMIIIAFVMAASLAAWLGLVFLADRAPRARRTTVAPLGARHPLGAAGAADGEPGDQDERGHVAEHGAAA